MRLYVAVAVATTILIVRPPLAFAQQQPANPGYFVPNQPKQAPARAPVRAAPRPAPLLPTPIQPSPGADSAGPPEPQLQMALPASPDLPALPKGAAPPAAVIGVLGVPEVMRASSAAQQVEKAIGARRDKLNQDAQKEQGSWRDQQQALVGQKGLTPDQIRAKERELQERITNEQRQLRDRNRIIQEAAQYGLAQIERTLIGVIRQVAESRGMNLVLHRAQVALNVNEFDLTDQVTAQLNKVLPSVTIPPDGVAPPTLPPGKDAAAPVASAASPAPAQ